MAKQDDSMQGKVCLVTGATAGIGLVTARELARRGAQVVGVGRNPEKCAATAEEIRRETGNEAIEFLVADLSAQAEIRRLAQEFQERFDRLDVLLNNAGAVFLERQLTVDGLERTFALNHLAYFTLTNLLLDTIKRSAPASIINVSSDAHKSVKEIDFDNLQGEKRYNGFQVYGVSKLANLLFTTELARRLEGTAVTVNALHPGFVNTSFFNGHGATGWIIRRIVGTFGKRPEQGAQTSIYLATAPEVQERSGQYFVNEAEATPSPLALDADAAQRLWELSEKMTQIRTPTV